MAYLGKFDNKMAYLTKFAEYYELGDYQPLNRYPDFIRKAVYEKNISKNYSHSTEF